ncbi:MAG TPA: ATP-binding protein [Geobacterales bacterium]|nr:ATP-binding protein [Geobacterales bacterium]
MRRYSRSLWFRLIFGLSMGSLAAVLVASTFLYVRFKNVSAESRERTLQGQAKLIAKLFQSAGGRELILPDEIAPYYGNGAGKFAVLFEDETFLTGSAGVSHAFHPIDREVVREFFSYAQPDGKPAYHGISQLIKGSSPPIWVQVAFADNEVIFDSVLEEFVIDIAWIWLPFVVILLMINMIVIRVSLKPLVQASEQAAQIGPMAVSKRISEKGLPREVLTLVRAINHALDRLEEGYREQGAFIADAAHELRTPIAIMTTHMDILPEFEGKAALKEELGGLKRLVNQLLDNARIEALRIAPNEAADLNALALDVAAFLAPCAIARGKTIEVSSARDPALVNGSYDYLFRALRNLVENAIEHTPAGTAVHIAIRSPSTLVVSDCGPGIPPAEREAIFERFWQGRRDRGGGAGLGMAIISRTVAAHKGTIEVGDREGGGAKFTVYFPPVAHAGAAFPAEAPSA